MSRIILLGLTFIFLLSSCGVNGQNKELEEIAYNFLNEQEKEALSEDKKVLEIKKVSMEVATKLEESIDTEFDKENLYQVMFEGSSPMDRGNVVVVVDYTEKKGIVVLSSK